MIKNAENSLTGEPLLKLRNSILKNPDIMEFLSEDNSFEFKRKTQFAPLVSVDVERTFSIIKSILIDKPHMKVETLEKYVVIRYNYDRFA